MSRFITEQQHKTSCGPVAVMNARKWLGESVSYRKEINDFKKLGWCPEEGTNVQELSQMLKHYNVKYKLDKKPSVGSIACAIEDGNAIILCYDWIHTSRTGGHYIFMDFNSIGFFNAYNYEEGFETGMVSELYVDQILWSTSRLRRNSRGRKGAWAWEIKADGA